MKILGANEKEIYIRMIRDKSMGTSIINTMRRYFQNDSEKPRKSLEYAIMDAMNRYFEEPSRKGV